MLQIHHNSQRCKIIKKSHLFSTKVLWYRSGSFILLSQQLRLVYCYSTWKTEGSHVTSDYETLLYSLYHWLCWVLHCIFIWMLSVRFALLFYCLSCVFSLAVSLFTWCRWSRSSHVRWILWIDKRWLVSPSPAPSPLFPFIDDTSNNSWSSVVQKGREKLTPTQLVFESQVHFFSLSFCVWMRNDAKSKGSKSVFHCVHHSGC